MTGPLPPPTPTGVRITGDHYQWVTAWAACLEVLRDRALSQPNPAVAVGVEASDAGNVDDVVTYRKAPPHTFQQVKYAVDSSTPVDIGYLTSPSDKGGPSILTKIQRARAKLSATSGAEPLMLRLVTNRLPDPSDELLQTRDSRTGLLLRRGPGGGPTSKLGIARRAWADAAGITETELVELLGVLHFDLGRELTDVEDRTGLLMQLAGLRGDEQAVRAGADWVAQQVQNGVQRLELDAIEQAVETLGLRAGPTRAVVSLATLVPDALANQAVYALDWVDRFDGDQAWSKRRPAAPATWAELQRDIEAIPTNVKRAAKVAVTGSYRLAPAFMVGAACRMVSGLDLAVMQRGVLWSSEDDYDAVEPPQTEVNNLGLGPDLAVAIGIATDLSEDVREFLLDKRVPVKELLCLRPAGGPKDNAVASPAQANAMSVGLRNAVRSALRGHPRVHLFLATPGGLAVLLGNRWNRIAETVIYEDLSTLGYEAAFTVSA